MKFKGIVTNRETKEKRLLEVEARTKKDALSNIRGNGYSIADQKLKKSEVWDWIVDHDDVTDREYKALWYFNDIPQTEEEYIERLINYCGKVYAKAEKEKERRKERKNKEDKVDYYISYLENLA